MLGASEILEKDEEVLFILKKHLLVLLKPAFYTILALALWVSGIVFLGFSKITSSFILLIIFLLWIVIVITYAFYEWVIWDFDIYILTDKRIIDVDQKTLFSRSVAEATLDKIQDVTVSEVGLFQTLFNYGNVLVQTAGEDNNITFAKISSPQKVQKNIIEAAQASKSKEKPLTADELIQALTKEKNADDQPNLGEKEKKEEEKRGEENKTEAES